MKLLSIKYNPVSPVFQDDLSTFKNLEMEHLSANLRTLVGNFCVECSLPKGKVSPASLHPKKSHLPNSESEILRVKTFIDDIGGKLGVKSFEDWYKVKISQLEQYGGTPLLKGIKSSGYLGKTLE